MPVDYPRVQYIGDNNPGAPSDFAYAGGVTYTEGEYGPDDPAWDTLNPTATADHIRLHGFPGPL